MIDVTDGLEGLFFFHKNVLCEDECCHVTVLCLDRNGPYSRDGSPLVHVTVLPWSETCI